MVPEDLPSIIHARQFLSFSPRSSPSVSSSSSLSLLRSVHPRLPLRSAVWSKTNNRCVFLPLHVVASSSSSSSCCPIFNLSVISSGSPGVFTRCLARQMCVCAWVCGPPGKGGNLLNMCVFVLMMYEGVSLLLETMKSLTETHTTNSHIVCRVCLLTPANGRASSPHLSET